MKYILETETFRKEIYLRWTPCFWIRNYSSLFKLHRFDWFCNN